MGNVVVGSGGRGWRNKASWRFVGLIAGVVVIAVSVGVAARLWQQRDVPESPVKSNVAEVVSEAIDYRGNKNYAKAHEVVDNALKAAGLTAADKYDLLMQRGATYVEQKEYDKAIEAYRQADAEQQTYSIASAIANAAEKKGDKGLAISFYRKAIARLADDDPLRDDTKQYFEQKISALESGGASDGQ